MKVDIKIICLVLLTLCMVAENDGWLWGKRSSSRISTRRSSSRTSTRSSSSSSRRYSRRTRSSRRRRGWFWGNRGPAARAKPTVASRRTQLPYNHQSSSSWRKCTWHYGIGCIQPAPKTTKAPVTQLSKTSTGPGVTITGRPHKKPTLLSSLITNTALIFQLLGGNLCLRAGSGWLLDDVIYCGKKNKVHLPKPNLRKVFPKIVVKIQIVERPLGHCGYVKYKKGKAIRVSRKYGRHTISCLKRHTMVTSISGKKDRVMHSGVVVETKDNKKYLIHKGKWSLTEKKTKIEVAKDSMFNKYTKIGRNFKPKKPRSVRDYYKESGNRYNFINDNCHDGTLRMVNLAKS